MVGRYGVRKKIKLKARSGRPGGGFGATCGSQTIGYVDWEIFNSTPGQS